MTHFVCLGFFLGEWIEPHLLKFERLSTLDPFEFLILILAQAYAVSILILYIFYVLISVYLCSVCSVFI